MALSGSDLKFLKSGTANKGGAVGGNSDVISSTTDMFFDAISGAQSEASQTDYRLMYLKNTNGDAGTQTAYQVKIYAALDSTIDQMVDDGETGVGFEWAILDAIASNTAVSELTNDTDTPTLPNGKSFAAVPSAKADAVTAAASLAGGAGVTTPDVVPIWLKRIYTGDGTRPAKDMVTVTFKGFFDTVSE